MENEYESQVKKWKDQIFASDTAFTLPNEVTNQLAAVWANRLRKINPEAAYIHSYSSREDLPAKFSFLFPRLIALNKHMEKLGTGFWTLKPQQVTELAGNLCQTFPKLSQADAFQWAKVFSLIVENHLEGRSLAFRGRFRSVLIALLQLPNVLNRRQFFRNFYEIAEGDLKQADKDKVAAAANKFRNTLTRTRKLIQELSTMAEGDDDLAELIGFVQDELEIQTGREFGSS